MYKDSLGSVEENGGSAVPEAAVIPLQAAGNAEKIHPIKGVRKKNSCVMQRTETLTVSGKAPLVPA